MYYGRKKWITIAIVAVVLVVLAIVATLVVLKTDLFKSDKVLFWKYVGKEFESGIPATTQLQDVEKMKEQSPYITNGELTISSTDEDANEVLEKIKLTLDSETDKVNKYSHTNAKVGYANATIFNLDYANQDDIYALKSDEIVTVYLGIRNENLKVLLQKLGVTDTTRIPDKIESIDYKELLKISDEEKAHIQETYTNIIINNISEDSYSKQTEAVIEKDGVSYNTTSYRLDLTADQISNILVNVLNTLKTDSITLNLIATKAKLLELDDEYSTVEGINAVIDDIIEEIQNAEFTDTSFVVYNYKGDTIATEILFRNELKMTIYNEDGNIKLVGQDLTGESDFETVSMDIMYAITSTHTNINIKLSEDEEEVMTFNITNTGSATGGSVQTTAEFTVTDESTEETISATYNQTLEFVSEIEEKENLDETNCAILNDYTQDQLTALVQALANQIVLVYNQKAQMLGIIPASEQIVEQNVTQ